MAGAENAGSIVYEVSAEVAPLLQGGRQVNRILSDIESALDDNINQFNRLETSGRTTAQAVSTATRKKYG